MTCATCGSIDKIHEESGSYEVPGLAWAKKKLREIAWVQSYLHLRQCPDCQAYYSHVRFRDTASGTAQESLSHTDDATTIKLLLKALTYFPLSSKSGVRASLEELLGPPELDAAVLKAGNPNPYGPNPALDLALYQAERLADPALVDDLTPYADTELGARALAACGAIGILADSGTPAAARGLGRSGSPDAAPHLVALLEHEQWQVRQSAAWALGELGAGADPLLALLHSGEPWGQVTRTAAEALARVLDTNSLVSALGDRDWSLRWETAKGIARTGRANAEIIDALRRAAIDPRGNVPAPQCGAVEALLAVGVPRADVQALLEEALASASDENFAKNLRYCLRDLG